MKTLEAKFANYDSLLKTHPQAAILGKSTIDLVNGLLRNIPQAKWAQLNNDPNTREIVQTCLVRLMNIILERQIFIWIILQHFLRQLNWHIVKSQRFYPSHSLSKKKILRRFIKRI